MSQEKSVKLNRFTTLPVLLDLLEQRRIVLLDPMTWVDKNDTFTISDYKKKKKVHNLFAICFCIGDETIHHWKAYANGISGCCIEFDKKKLMTHLKNVKEVRCGNVIYKKIRDIKMKRIKLDMFPFVKRRPYKNENEFRIIWEGRTKKETIPIGIDLSAINKITISPDMPLGVFRTIKGLLENMTEGFSIKINKSTLYDNERWKDVFSKMYSNE